MKSSKVFLILTLALLSSPLSSSGLEETTTTGPGSDLLKPAPPLPPAPVDETNISLPNGEISHEQTNASSTTGAINSNSSSSDSSTPEVVSGDEIRVDPISSAGSSTTPAEPSTEAASTASPTSSSSQATAESTVNKKVLPPTIDEAMKDKSAVSGTIVPPIMTSENVTPSPPILADGNDSPLVAPSLPPEASSSTSPQPDRPVHMDVSEEAAETSTARLQLDGGANELGTGVAASTSSSSSTPSSVKEGSNRGHKKILSFQKTGTISTSGLPDSPLTSPDPKTPILLAEGRMEDDSDMAGGNRGTASSEAKTSAASPANADDGNEILHPADPASGSGTSSTPSSSSATSREERKTLLFSKPSTTTTSTAAGSAASEIIPLVSLTSGTQSTTPSPPEPAPSVTAAAEISSLKPQADTESTTNRSSSSVTPESGGTESSAFTSVTVPSSSSIAPETGMKQTAVPVISSTRGGNSSMTSALSHPEARIENESGESGRAGEGSKMWTGIPDSGRFREEVNVSQSSGVTNYAASSFPSPASPADSPLDARRDPVRVPALTSALSPASSEPSNNLSPSDTVAPEQPSSPSSVPPHTSTEAVKEGGEGNVNHYGDHSEGDGHEAGSSDDPTPATSPPSTAWPDQHQDPQPALNTDQNATEFFPSFPVPSTTNHTASTATSNMTDEAEAKCNRENSSSSSSRYNLSGLRLNTFEAVIWIFILVFVICAVFVLLFVFTIFRRKGNHTFDFQVRLLILLLFLRCEFHVFSCSCFRDPRDRFSFPYSITTSPNISLCVAFIVPSLVHPLIRCM